jgi:hypothetical protein
MFDCFASVSLVTVQLRFKATPDQYVCARRISHVLEQGSTGFNKLYKETFPTRAQPDLCVHAAGAGQQEEIGTTSVRHVILQCIRTASAETSVWFTFILQLIVGSRVPAARKSAAAVVLRDVIDAAGFGTDRCPVVVLILSGVALEVKRGRILGVAASPLAECEKWPDFLDWWNAVAAGDVDQLALVSCPAIVLITVIVGSLHYYCRWLLFSQNTTCNYLIDTA